MFAVVLVGGFGTRLRPLTYDVPKPMLPVVHRPMIARQVEQLAAGGVTDVVLALGFKPEPFAAAFPGQRLGDVRIHYVVEPEPLDTGGAVAFAARQVGIDTTFVVANGDIVTDLDVGQLVSQHHRMGGAATIHLTPVADPSSFGVVEISAGGQVERFIEKPLPGSTDSNLINAGTYVWEPDVVDLIAAGRRVSVERETFQLLVELGRLSGLPTDDYWLDTGRPELYLQANLDLIRGLRGAVAEPAVHPGAVVSGARIIESVVSDGATVARDALVTASVVLPGASIGVGAVVESSIVAGRVGARAEVCRCVIGATGEVPDRAVVIDERLPRPE